MMRKVRVEEPGDTKLLSGTVVDVYEFEDANAEVQARIDAGEADLKEAKAQLAETEAVETVETVETAEETAEAPAAEEKE